MEQAASTDIRSASDLLLQLVDRAGPPVAAIAVVLIITIAVIIVGLKMSGVGFAFGAKKALVDTGKVDNVAADIAAIKETLGVQLAKVEDRMTDLEKDLDRRATREEMHKLELAFTKMEGRFETIDQRTLATAQAVGRIESFMYEAAMRSRGEKA